MSLVQILVVAIFFGICLVPVFLLRRRDNARASDYFVASGPTPPEVVQNSSIAYALRVVMLGPFFAWGATGDLAPAVIAAVCFGLGLQLIVILRRPILAFLDDALGHDRSITVHAFIARHHGNDSRVRLLAASLTVFSLVGFISAEAFGMASLLKPFVMGEAMTIPAIMLCLSVLMVLYAIPSGSSGSVLATQALLGVFYLGLFGSAACLLYLHASDLRPMPPHGTLAVLFIAGFCLAILRYRRTKYVDTGFPDLPAASSRQLLAIKIFRVSLKLLNTSISVLAVLIVVIALMESYFWGPSAIVRGATAAVTAGTRMSVVGLIGLAALALLYPIVDVTNWQRIAVLVKNEGENPEQGTGSEPLRKIFRRYAIESPLLLLFIAMFGALAVVSTETPVSATVMQDFVEQLISFDNEVSDTAVTLMLLSVLAIALSLMSSAFSAVLCTIRYDVLPALRPDLNSMAHANKEAGATRHTIFIGAALVVAMGLVFAAVGALLEMKLNDDVFIALLLACACVQLALAPLVIGALMGRNSAARENPKLALLILGLSVAGVIGTTAVYLSSGIELWLWATIPACLGWGLLLLIAPLWTGGVRGSAP